VKRKCRNKSVHAGSDEVALFLARIKILKLHERIEENNIYPMNNRKRVMHQRKNLL
jgi:hypothetical protein